MRVALHGSHGTPKKFGYLALRQVFVEAEHQACPLTIRQETEGVPEDLVLVDDACVIQGIATMRQSGPRDASSAVMSDVQSGATQVGANDARLELLKRRSRPHIGLLHDVLRVSLLLAQGKAEPNQRCIVQVERGPQNVFARLSFPSDHLAP